MVLHKLVRRYYGGKSLVSIKYQNLYSFKEGMIILCQSILEMRRILHSDVSALFTIPLSVNIGDIAIITLKDVDCCCIIHDISKSEAIN